MSDATDTVRQLSELEAELVRLAEAEYARAAEDARTARARSITYVLRSAQVPPGAKWTLEDSDTGGLQVRFHVPQPEGAPS